MERAINSVWCLFGDFNMITLAKKLLLFKNEQAIKVVNGAVEFVSSTAMTITPKYTNAGVTLEYSLDGTSWTNIASGATTPSANIIYFRGSATGTKNLYTSSLGENAWVFTGSTNLECNGKLDRLLQDALGDDNDILTIYDYCFCYMFYNVITLIKAPELPATTLANECYKGMFYGCRSLTIAPILPATTLAASCYIAMFNGCRGLTTAPILPATTLAMYCYYGMFNGCISLTVIPELPATTLAMFCYYGMFSGCTSLKLSTTMTGIYDTAYRIPTTGTGTTATNSLTNMFTNTGGTFTGTPTINTTYYTENTPV